MESNGASFFNKQPIFILDQHTLDILDVNNSAIELYGFSREEFCSKNLNDLGEQKNRLQIVGAQKNGTESGDRLWVHRTKDGKRLYIQFTSHVFNYDGQPAKLAVAHDVQSQIKQRERRRIKYPKYVKHESNYPLAEIEWDAELRVMEWSYKAEKLFGWSAREVAGEEKFYSRLIPDDEIEAAFQNLHAAVENQQKHYTSEGEVITKSGNILTCRWYNTLMYDETGDLLSIHSLAIDVSTQKESENLFRTLSEESLVGVYLIQDGTFKYVNPRFAEIFGYEKEELIEKLSPMDLTHPSDRSMAMKTITERIQGETEIKEEELQCVTNDGRIIDVSTYGSTIIYKGEPAIVGTLVNITQDKEVARKYRAGVETFRDLFDSISDAIYIQDKDGYLLEVNRGAVEMYGYDKKYLIGKTPEVLAALGKVDLQKMKSLSQEALKGNPQSFSWWGKRKNGEVFPEEIILNPGTYFGEEVVITIARDISDRYKAEEEMRKNEEMFRQLFQNAPVPITMMDKRQEIRQVNSSFEETFGYKTEEVEGLNIDKLLVPKGEIESAQKVSEAIFEGKSAFHTGKRLCKDGRLVDVLIYGVPVMIDGRTIAIFGIYVDITDRKHAEEKVKKSLKEKEVLLAEIHHRVKNNLAVITGLLELQSYNTNSEDATEVLKASQMRVNSIALIHEKLYQSENLSEISFDTYLEELTDVIASSMKSESIDVSIAINAEPIEFTISQAIPCGLILNELITNAYKHAFLGRKEGKIDITISKEDKIKLTFQDNGRGIPDDISLENPGSLGIKLIRTLSKQLNGEAQFTTNDTGTKFTLQFGLED